MKINRRKIFPIVLVIFVLMQFIRIDKTNPTVVPANDIAQAASVPPNISTMLKNACYDCHSNETKYPWYTNVAPVSWWIKGHINGARESLNFSEWGTFSESKKKHSLEECHKFVTNGWMPPKSYKFMHPEAKLSEEDITTMLNWLAQ